MIEKSIEKLRNQNEKGRIDPLSNFASGRAVHIISGENDPTVPPENQDALLEIFLELGIPSDKVTLSRDTSKHGFKDTYPQEMLKFLWKELDYGELQEAGNDRTKGTVYTFDQREFYPSTLDWNTHRQLKNRENGLIYIPEQCEG